LSQARAPAASAAGAVRPRQVELVLEVEVDEVVVEELAVVEAVAIRVHERNRLRSVWVVARVHKCGPVRPRLLCRSSACRPRGSGARRLLAVGGAAPALGIGPPRGVEAAKVARRLVVAEERRGAPGLGRLRVALWEEEGVDHLVRRVVLQLDDDVPLRRVAVGAAVVAAVEAPQALHVLRAQREERRPALRRAIVARGVLDVVVFDERDDVGRSAAGALLRVPDL